jgi:very-short-patch-repair endonuclease
MVDRLAAKQAGIVALRALYAEGITRAEVRANVRARRWRRCGTHAVATFTGPLSEEARHWVALIEGGPRAMLDGESSLLVAGLVRYRVRRIRVTVPRGARIRHRGSQVDIRQTRRWAATDLDPASPIPRTRTPVAAVRAFLWASSPRQATLVLTMVVQQELASVEELAEAAVRILRDPRRDLLHEVILELAGGVRSLGELDVVRMCRDRHLPSPTSQTLVRTPDGRYYLDLRWAEFGLVVEVDGIQHLWAEQVVGDSLRHNTVALGSHTVLRLPLLGLRLVPDAFFEQIEAGLRAGGWTPDVAA